MITKIIKFIHGIIIEWYQYDCLECTYSIAVNLFT